MEISFLHSSATGLDYEYVDQIPDKLKISYSPNFANSYISIRFKSIKKYNESNTYDLSKQIKELFYDLSDNGFEVNIHNNNNIIFKEENQ